MDMAGIVLVPYDTDPLTVHFQANHATNIADNPNHASVNLGEIYQYGLTVMSTLKTGVSTRLNLFASEALDESEPNENTFGGMPVGLMYTGTKEGKTGSAVYLGARLDLPSRTKIGFEFNHGSKNWISFVPAGAVAAAAAADENKMVGVITKIDIAGPDATTATVDLKDNRTGETATLVVNDELTLDKFKDHRIVTGDGIRRKYEAKDGKNVSRYFRKTAGC